MEATRSRTIASSMIKIMMVIMMVILVNVQAYDHHDYLINIPSNTVTPDDNALVEDQTVASPPPPNSVIGDVGRCASECAAMCGRRHSITTASASTDRFFFPWIPGFIKPPRIRRPGGVRKPRRPGGRGRGRGRADSGDCYKDCLLDCGLQAPSSLSQCTAGCAYNSVTATASTLLTEDKVQNYVDSCYKECQKNN